MKKKFRKETVRTTLLALIISSLHTFPVPALSLTHSGKAEAYAREYQLILDQATENGISMNIGNDKETLATYFHQLAPSHTDDITFEVAITDRDDSGPGKFKPAIPGTEQDPDGTNGRAGVRVFIYSSYDHSSSKADALFRITASNYYGEAQEEPILSTYTDINQVETNTTSITTDAGIWEYSKNRWHLLLPNGTYATSKWVLVDGKWYWFDFRGRMVTGWIKLEDQWYYLDDSGAMVTGWINLHDVWFYLDSNGVMLHDTTTPDGYYVNSNGVWVE